MKKKKVDILLPCYNEEKTIKECINRIKRVMDAEKYDYTIVICDNNSTDNSVKIAKSQKVKVLIEKEKGYGATLLNGINKSRADYIVMLDSDLSYNEKHIPKLLSLLEENDMVIGNRFKGTIEKKAMPIAHFYGSRFLTEYANLLFRVPSHDYHCGLRAFKRDKILECNLSSKGFEFASEMIIKAKLNNLKIIECPTDLFVDGRDKKPHLKTIRDGYRHLHLINKIKFQNSALFRYITTFLILIAIYFLSLVVTSFIPRNLIYNNTAKSFEFFEKYYKNNTIKGKSYMKIEGCGDVRNISMAYNMNPHKPIDSAIRMSYQIEIDNMKNLKDIFINNTGEKINYSRYWQGQAMYSKIMLLLMPVGYSMYLLQLLSLIILFILITKKKKKKDKIIAISFIIMNLSINAFFTAFSVQYYFATLLMYIFTLLILKAYEKNSKNICLLFALSGSLTCFFDFLTCETLTLTIPLFIYIFLSLKEKKEVTLKFIIKCIIIWGLFYSLTFLTKWLIDILYFGIDYRKEIFQKAMIRVGNENLPIYMRFGKSILLSIGSLLPFSFFKNSMIIPIILILISLHILIFEQKQYSLLLIPTIIPIIRSLILSTHSYYFYYFTYRSYGILILFVNLLIFQEFYCKVIKK